MPDPLRCYRTPACIAGHQFLRLTGVHTIDWSDFLISVKITMPLTCKDGLWTGSDLAPHRHTR